METGEFITLERSSPKFNTYLTGEFSKTNRALPVRTFNVNSEFEKITFQVVPASDIARPSFLLLFARILRLELLSLTITPAIVATGLSLTNLANVRNVVFSLISLFFLHGAVFCRNDFIDHMRGVDRLSEKGGSHVIQNGWLRAITVKRLYISFLVVAGLFALPVLWSMPYLSIFSIAALLGVMGYSHLRWGFGHWMLGDFAIFLCLGPLLCVGMSWVAGGASFSLASIWVGIYFGLLALSYVELRHTISSVVDHEAGIDTLPVNWGFDRAKIAIVVILLVAAFVTMQIANTSSRAMFLVAALPIIGYILWITKTIAKLSSPLSSTLYELPRHVLRLHLLSGLFFVAIFFL